MCCLDNGGEKMVVPRGPKDAACDAGELDVRQLQRFLQSVAFCRAVLDELATVAHQVTQPSD